MKGTAKWKRISLWAVSILAAIVAIVFISLKFVKKDLRSNESTLKPAIAKQVKKLARETSDSLYKVDFSAFNFSIDSGFCLISNFRLSVDTNIYSKLETRNE